jgi:hypothetical protein
MEPSEKLTVEERKKRMEERRPHRPKTTAVLVTTEHRGVFHGWLDDGEDGTGEIVVLKDARLCVKWSAEIRGFMGLAVFGPNADCRIGPMAKRMRLRNVTAVVECLPEAVDQWEMEWWSET